MKADLEPSALRTHCTYKGTAHYWSLQMPDGPRPNIAWTYADPAPEVAAVRDLVCFFNEQVDLEVDGEPQQRPITPWEGRRWWDRAGDFEDQL